jgi:hypothetical protein
MRGCLSFPCNESSFICAKKNKKIAHNFSRSTYTSAYLLCSDPEEISTLIKQSSVAHNEVVVREPRKGCEKSGHLIWWNTKISVRLDGFWTFVLTFDGLNVILRLS